MDIGFQLRQICGAFRIPGSMMCFEHIKIGHINQTYKVTFRQPEGDFRCYILQKLNTCAFKRPTEVMHNIDLITAHLRLKAPDGVALYFHHTEDGKNYVIDGADFWRLCNYIPSVTYGSGADPVVLMGAAEAFGEFQRMLSDFDASRLYETICNFHNTPKRLEQLFADAEADPMGRAKEVREELSYLRSVAEDAGRLTRMQEAGALPLRVTHNDTKLNNVLFDRDSGKALAVVDLDTVMPGLVAHDFGDAIRFAANTAAEDCPDSERVCCDLEVFRTFAKGFLAKTGDILTPAEKDTLALSPFVLAVELSGRFLDDYLTGDRYFSTRYPGHNLVRARCQLALAKDFWRKQDEMSAIIKSFI